MARRPRCAVCGSKRWHQGAGGLMCEEGHILQGYVQESTESQETSKYATRTRNVRKNRVKKARSSYDRNDHFHGARADFLKWQSIQFVLRQQLKVLIDDLGFPGELELVVKDLWSMLVVGAGLVDAPNEYYVGEEGLESFSGRKEGWVSDKKRNMGKGKQKAEGDEQEEAESDDQSEDEEERRKREDVNSSSEEDDELVSSHRASTRAGEPPDEPPVKKQRRISSNNDVDKGEPRSRSQSVKVEQESDSPSERINISFTLILLYLGCCTLRLPVFFSDILKMAETYQILYLDARNFLPTEMRNHLNLFDQKALSPNIVGVSSRMPREKDDFTYWIAHFVKMYEQDWNVRFPEANMPLITWRICKTLDCSPIIYTSLRTLLSLLPPMNFVLGQPPRTVNSAPQRPGQPQSLPPFSDNPTASFVPRTAEGKYKWRTVRWNAVGELPEVIVLSNLIVLLKLVYGTTEDDDFATQVAESRPSRLLANDNDGRKSPDKDDIAQYLPTLRDWLQTLTKINQVRDAVDDPSVLWKDDIASMDGDSIDDYLSFCEKNIAFDHRVSTQTIRDIDRHFPRPHVTPRPPPPDSATQINDLIAKLYSRPLPHTRSSADSSPAIPGANYRPIDADLAADYSKYNLVVDKITSILDLSLASPSNYLLHIAASTEQYLSERNPAELKKELAAGIEKGRLESVARQQVEWEYERDRRAQLTLADKQRREVQEARTAEEELANGEESDSD